MTRREFIITIIFVISVVLLLWFFKKKTESYITVGGKQFSYCNIITGIMENLETQLKNAFPPTNRVGPITLTIFDNTTTFPDLSKFTQDVNITFNIPLPSPYSPLSFKASNAISFSNVRSIWDSIYISDNHDSENPFSIFLDPSWYYVYSKTDLPVCSNAWGEIHSIVLTDFYIKNFASSLIIDYDKNLCSTIAKDTLEMQVPFTIRSKPNVNLKLHSHFGHGSGTCSVYTHLGKCEDPSSSCFWNGCKPTSKCHHDHSYTRCKHDLNVPCPDLQTHIPAEVNANVNIDSTVNSQNIIHFTINVGSDITISDIYIKNIKTDYNMDNIHIDTTGSTGHKFIKKFNLESVIQASVKAPLDNIIKMKIPKLFDSINSVLLGKKVALN